MNDKLIAETARAWRISVAEAERRFRPLAKPTPKRKRGVAYGISSKERARRYDVYGNGHRLGTISGSTGLVTAVHNPEPLQPGGEDIKERNTNALQCCVNQQRRISGTGRSEVWVIPQGTSKRSAVLSLYELFEKPRSRRPAGLLKAA